MRKPLKKFRVVVLRVEREYGVLEVEAENENRARSKAEYKAANGHCEDWSGGDLTVEATRIEELK